MFFLCSFMNNGKKKSACVVQSQLPSVFPVVCVSWSLAGPRKHVSCPSKVAWLLFVASCGVPGFRWELEFCSCCLVDLVHLVSVPHWPGQCWFPSLILFFFSLCIFYILAALHRIWEHSPPTRDQIHAPCTKGKVSTTGLPGKSPSDPSVSVCCSSVTQSCLFATAGNAAQQASLSITVSRSLLKLVSIELVMPSNHLILCRPLLLLPSIFPRSRVFSNELALCIKCPKYWSFGFSISPSSEYSGLI